MIKKKSRSMIALFLVLLLVVVTVIVNAASDGSVKNIVRTQGVDIRVSAEVDDSLISPGKDVAYKPVIENKGADSWVRFKLTADSELPLDNFYGLSSDWVEKGGYWYLTKPVLSKETVPTVEGFKVPDTLTDQSDTEIEVGGTYDAIQSDNFKPDFNSENPWGDVNIVESDFDGSNYIRTVANIQPITVDIGSSDDVVITSDDILSYDLIPGDMKSNTLVIENTSSVDKQVNFKSISDRENALLQNIYIGIGDSEKEIYDGALSEANFDKEIATIPAGDTATINYEISIPTEVGNALQGEKGEFEWHFTSEEIPEVVKTNDAFPVMIFFIIVALSAAGIPTVLKVRRRNEK